MKKLFTIFVLMLLSSLLSAQSPQAFKYQAVARNLNGDPVIDQEIAIKISILSGSETGPTVYSELHEIPTNGMGLFTLEIGNASIVLSGNFTEIGWGVFPHFLKTEIDITGGSNYQLMGVSQLLSVPYALYANEAGNAENYTAGSGINVSNGVISNTAPNATHTGDATGDHELTVVKIQGKDIATTEPINGQALKWNSNISKWQSATDNNTTYTSGTGINIAGNVINNSMPDQTVVLTGGTGIGTSGTYPNFTVANTSPNANHTGDASGGSELTVGKIQGRSIATTAPSNGEVLQWNMFSLKWEPATDDNTIYTAGSGINVAGTVISNTSPDQTVVLTGGTGIGASGTYPNFTVTNTSPNAFHSGDATGNGALTVTRIQGKAISVTPPATNQVLQWTGTQWVPSSLPTPSADWSLTGNSGTATSDFIGTTDNIQLNFRVNNFASGIIDHLYFNTSLGYKTLLNNSDGTNNTAIGALALTTNTEGIYNTATGSGVLTYNTTGDGNTANGAYALLTNTTGNYNTAIGGNSLYSNTNGTNNIANGYYALYLNTVGNCNVALGAKALYKNISRSNLVAVGDSALFNNGTGVSFNYEATANTAIGSKSLFSNTTGYQNTSIGNEALYNNTFGDNNTANGYHALYTNGLGATAYWECSHNTAMGSNALFANTTGSGNTATGYLSLNNNTDGENNTANGNGSLSGNTTGNNNTAHGTYSLSDNTTGGSNTAAGYSALGSNTTGSFNTASGFGSLYYNTTGFSNVAVGVKALNKNTTRSNLVAIGDSALFNNGVGATNASHATRNTAVGSKALYANTTGYSNTANGDHALYSNTSGTNNTATGFSALNDNTTGVSNTATGVTSLSSNTTGNSNTANGLNALTANTIGSQNTASGVVALYSNTEGDNNTAKGFSALYSNTTGSFNTAMGNSAGYFGTTHNQCTFIGASTNLSTIRSNVTLLGYGIGNAQCTGNNQVLLGNTAISQIRAAVTGITAYSDERFKTNIKNNVAGLDFILKLKPVTYNTSPKELHNIWGTPDSVMKMMDFSDAEKDVRIGFVAQDVEKAALESGFDFPGIDVPKNDKEVYSLRYTDFIMPLVKAVQEQQVIIDTQQKQIEELMKRIEILENK
jgi:hypothetical protein